MLRIRFVLATIATLTAAACATPEAPAATGTASVPTATPTPTLPTSISDVVTTGQVAAVRAEAARQGAVVTFARTDPDGIVVVRPPAGRGSGISTRSLAAVVEAQGGPGLEIKVASTGVRRERLADAFEQYAANNSRPGTYLTFGYRKQYAVFTLATNAPVDSLKSFLQAHGDEVVVTYASPGCRVCGG